MPEDFDTLLAERRKRKGNIDLAAQPRVKNRDGTTSTVRSISINEDGEEVLIPTVVGDRVVSDDEAVGEYRRTGRHLGWHWVGNPVLFPPAYDGFHVVEYG